MSGDEGGDRVTDFPDEKNRDALEDSGASVTLENPVFIAENGSHSADFPAEKNGDALEDSGSSVSLENPIFIAENGSNSAHSPAEEDTDALEDSGALVPQENPVFIAENGSHLADFPAEENTDALEDLGASVSQENPVLTAENGSNSADFPAEENTDALKDSGALVSQENPVPTAENGSDVSQKAPKYTAAMAYTRLNSQLMRQLECPVCLYTCMPPIFMCPNGHIVCVKCQPRLKACHTCRALGKPTVRCLQLEKIAALLKHSCSNLFRGCTLLLSYEEMSKHIPKCEYSLKCLICETWKGCKQDLTLHVNTKHSKKCYKFSMTGFKIMNTKLPTNIRFQDKRKFEIIFYNDEMFWFESHFSSATRIFSKIMRIASHDAERASRYRYSVEFKPKQAKNNFNVFFQGDVQTMEGMNGGMEIVVPVPIIESYESGVIKYALKISPKKGVARIKQLAI